MRNKIAIVVSILILCLFYSCDAVTTFTHTITNPSQREIYKREFKENQTAFNQWDSIYKIALADSLSVPMPYGEKANKNSIDNHAYSYKIQLEAGEMLHAKVTTDSIIKRVFIDVLAFDNSKWKSVTSSDPFQMELEYVAKTSGIFKVIIQPEIESSGKLFIALNKLPSYGFPVAGKGNAAIGSFWADARDGGKRKHEGIDIFAKRGTPIVAVTNGIVSYTGEKGIGGKQVWQRSGFCGNSIYYAHLDSIAVSDGMSVKQGDTLGFVGNTGNAKTTSPHLHFGIYQNHGAVDPKPFVYQTEKLKPSAYPLKYNKTSVIVQTAKAALRNGPSVKNMKLGELSQKDNVVVLGQHKDWLHIKTKRGQVGFVHESLVRS